MTSAVRRSILCADPACSMKFLITSLSVAPVTSNEHSIPRPLHTQNAAGLLFPLCSNSTGVCPVQTCIVPRILHYLLNHSVVMVYKFILDFVSCDAKTAPLIKFFNDRSSLLTMQRTNLSLSRRFPVDHSFKEGDLLPVIVHNSD